MIEKIETSRIMDPIGINKRNQSYLKLDKYNKMILHYLPQNDLNNSK